MPVFALVVPFFAIFLRSTCVYIILYYYSAMGVQHGVLLYLSSSWVRVLMSCLALTLQDGKADMGRSDMWVSSGRPGIGDTYGLLSGHGPSSTIMGM